MPIVRHSVLQDAEQPIDRIDAMRVFVAVLDEGSLAGAGRSLALLEGQVGVQLLHRTTRSSKPSEAGERYAAACRRVLTDLEDANILAAGEIGPARHSYPDGAARQRRGGVASDPRCLSRRQSGGVGEALSARPACEPD